MSVAPHAAASSSAALPVGERVGIAFSGGLDTCCALAWMREHGAIPYAFTADLGQYDEPDIDAVPDRARLYGAEDAVLVDCKEALAREGLAALQCGAFHIQTAGRRYFNTTPLGRAVTGTLLVHAMARARRRDLGRRLDLQGQRHRALLPLRPARERALRIYKPWLDAAFVGGARRPQGDERVARGARAAARHVGREGVLDRREHARRDARGEGPRAPRDEHEDRRADHGRGALGPEVEIEPETVTIALRERAAGRDRRRRDRETRSS